MGAIGKSIVLSALLVAGASLPARANCPCPKSQMIELYGSVSMYPKQLPGPRLHQPQRVHVKPTVPVTTLPSMADVAKAMPTPTLDKMANPLLWDPVFVSRQ
ncbi:hypothetical protein [Dongia rigui]|uniref:Uncharacterized protein n=1 Tax=Dongia rigui TaxID=940149 RepID=A0ABU5DY51_9PROT|nr:hypothetical protein [Dongia rigui]MDY0872252.1 hypothetical protein [Dongia rigui]